MESCGAAGRGHIYSFLCLPFTSKDEFMSWMTRSRRHLAVKGIVLVSVLALIFLLSRFVPQPFTAVGSLGEELEKFYTRRRRMTRFLTSFGPYSAAVFVLVQALQVVISPIPGEFTGLVGGYLYGDLFGFILSSVGLTLGSWLAFEIARHLGRPFVERRLRKEVLDKFNFVTSNVGAVLCFLLFLIPGFPKDYLCYLLGISRMSLGVFLMASTLGRMPGTYLLTSQGANLREHNYVALIIVAVISVALLFLAYLYRERLHHWLKNDRNRSSQSDISPD